MLQHHIQLLPPVLANQIAAGEVVERPASVVKELLENALDAGATRIELHIEKGGIQRIAITDNGCGINKDELGLALARHATSKIHTIDDLMHINSLGFRGEALASISSVSQLTLSSKPEQQTSAWQIVSHSDASEITLKPCAHPTGTTIEIVELFFNTPARRKFLRSETTEFTHIEEVVRRLALSHFAVGFSLHHNGKLIWQTPAATTVIEQEQRLIALLGAIFLKHCVAIDIERHGLRLQGWMGLPTHSRSQKDQQYFYINGRMVRDKIVAHAINQGYQDVLYGHRHPVFVLYFSCDPELVDVNVHPTKHEVRFRESRLAHDFIYHAIHTAIGSLTPPHTTLAKQEHSKTTEEILFSTQAATPIQQQMHYAAPNITAQISSTISAYEQLHPSASDEKKQHDFVETPPLGYALGQLHGIFIVAQNAQGLVLIDMHAAHERIVYEQMKENIAAKKFPTQQLLLPLIIKVSPTEAETAEQHLQAFAEMGFTLARLGHDSVRITSIPVALTQLNHELLLRDIFADLNQHGLSHRLSNILMEQLGNKACKRAIKAHHQLSIPEMNVLLRTMEKTPRYGQCNHGRPTVHYLSLAEIDQLFLRGR